jgi:tetratricopeptide (TPR) repeat protein
MPLSWLSVIPAAARWLWNKIRRRPTVQADRGAVAAGRDQAMSGPVATGDHAAAAASRGLSIGQAAEALITQINVERVEKLVLQTPPPAIEAGGHGDPEFRASASTALRLSEQGEHKQAVLQLQRTFARAADDTQRYTLHYLIAHEFASLGGSIEAEGEYRQAVHAALAAHDRPSAIAALDGSSLGALRNQNWRSLEAYSRLAARLHKRTGDPEQAAAELTSLSSARRRRGRPAAAAAAARRALQLTVGLPPSTAQADALVYLSVAQFDLRRWDEAAETSRWAVAVSQALGDLTRESAARRLLELVNEVKTW